MVSILISPMTARYINDARVSLQLCTQMLYSNALSARTLVSNFSLAHVYCFYAKLFAKTLQIFALNYDQFFMRKS